MKWFENCHLVGKLWFNDKMTWKTKEEIHRYLWEHKEDKKIMDEVYETLTYMVKNIDRVHPINF